MSALAVTGVVEQAERNHSWWLYTAMALVVIAGVVFALAALSKNVWQSRRWALNVLGVCLLTGVAIVLSAVVLTETVTWGPGSQKVAAVLGAGGLVTVIAARFAPARIVRLAPMLGGFAIVALSAGLLCGMVAVILAQQDTPRPTITASIREGSPLVLTAQVKVQDISWDKHIRATVDAVVWKRDRSTGKLIRENGYLVAREKQRLYSVWVGPDKSGDVDHSISLVLPPTLREEIAIHAWAVDKPSSDCSVAPRRDSDCPTEEPPPCYTFAGRFQAGCLKLRLIPALSRPRISATLRRVDDRYMVSAKVDALRVHESRTVRVRLIGIRRDGSTAPILSSRMNPDDSGTVQGSWDVPVPTGTVRVCAAAMFVASASAAPRSAARPNCPPRPGGAVAWTVLVVPPLD